MGGGVGRKPKHNSREEAAKAKVAARKEARRKARERAVAAGTARNAGRPSKPAEEKQTRKKEYDDRYYKDPDIQKKRAETKHEWYEASKKQREQQPLAHGYKVTKHKQDPAARDRIMRVRRDRHTRLDADRDRDLTRAADARTRQNGKRHGRNGGDRTWPPLKPDTATPTERLNKYFEELANLSQPNAKHAPHTCSNCHQRATDHQRDSADDERCWYCKKSPGTLCEDSIPLALEPGVASHAGRSDLQHGRDCADFAPDEAPPSGPDGEAVPVPAQASLGRRWRRAIGDAHPNESLNERATGSDLTRLYPALAMALKQRMERAEAKAQATRQGTEADQEDKAPDVEHWFDLGDEWDSLGIDKLSRHDYIQVDFKRGDGRNGTTYFRPDWLHCTACAACKWQALRKDWGDLTIMEEALVSRVSSCVSVLQLPGCWVEGKQYSQLGYRGSVINFTNDLGTVAAQLPRAPKDSGIVVYAVEGTTKSGQAFRDVVNVRRHAIEEHLRFFAQHHDLYKYGIDDPRGGPHLVSPFTEADIDAKAVTALPQNGIPAGIKHLAPPTRNLGADEELPPARRPRREEGSSSEGDGESEDEGNAKPSLDESELRNRPVPEPLLVHWLRKTPAPGVAADLRIFCEEDGNDVQSTDGLEAVLNAIHGIGYDEPRWTNRITLATLAQALVERFYWPCNNAEELIEPLRGELVAAGQAIDPAFEDSGVAHGVARGESPPDGEAPLDWAKLELDAWMEGQHGTAGAPFQVVPRGTVPICEYRTKGYVTLAFPTLFPFGRGDFASVDTKHGLTWVQWSQHVQKYQDCRFATHRRFPYFMLNTHEREVASKMAGLFVNERGTRPWTVGELRTLNRADRDEVLNNITKFSNTLRNTPAFYKDRRKELSAMCEQVGDPHVSISAASSEWSCEMCVCTVC